MQQKRGQGRGILHAQDGAQVFRVNRFAPDATLAPYIDYMWTVRWDRRGLPPYLQVNLPDPALHLSFERPRSRVYGPSRARFEKLLVDVGHVFAVKFRPGGILRFWDGDLSTLQGRTVDVDAIFSADVSALEAALLDDVDDLCAKPLSSTRNTEKTRDLARAETLATALASWARYPVDVEELQLVQRVADTLLTTVDGATIGDVAAREGISPRTLQRLFKRYVGYAPKWISQRGRLQVAAKALAEGTSSIAQLAHELGYADQAHFARAFKAEVGQTPAEFSKGRAH